MKASITYTITTPESAEHGDWHDHGFYQPGGWIFSMNNDRIRADIMKNPKDYELSFRTAIKTALEKGIHEGQVNSDGLSVSTVDPEENYITGAKTHYTLHLSGLSNGTVKRVRSYLESKGCKFY